MASPAHSTNSAAGLLQSCCGRCCSQRYQVSYTPQIHPVHRVEDPPPRRGVGLRMGPIVRPSRGLSAIAGGSKTAFRNPSLLKCKPFVCVDFVISVGLVFLYIPHLTFRITKASSRLALKSISSWIKSCSVLLMMSF